MIKGYVEVLRPFQVRGWALDPAALDIPVPIRLTVNGQRLATGLADQFRADLAAAWQSNGRHAFVLNVAATLPLDQPETILVEAVTADGATQPLPALTAMAIEPPEIKMAAPRAATSITGYVELSPSAITGWAYDQDQPDEHLQIMVEARGQLLGIVLADRFRADLARAGIGLGDHAFGVTLPPALQNPPATEIAAFALAAGGNRVPLILVVPQTAAPPLPPPAAIFPSPFTDTEHEPVIILGAARSGTSAIAQALLASGVYAGCEEGFFLNLLAPLTQAASRYYTDHAEEWSERRATHLRQVPQNFVQQGLRHIMLEGARLAFPSGRWVDKTPRASMIALAPGLREIWPRAKFIYMRRRGIENLESCLRKFPGHDFEAQCREWALSIQNWYAVVGALEGAAVELDQLHMANHPDEVAVALGRFLQLPHEALERFAQALRFDQPERTSTQFGRAANLAELGWPARYVERFRAICGEAMHQAGYEEDERYFADGAYMRGIMFR